MIHLYLSIQPKTELIRFFFDFRDYRFLYGRLENQERILLERLVICASETRPK